MDFEILVKQALLILDQERLTPTLSYTYVGKTMPSDPSFYIAQQGGHLPAITAIYALQNMRKQRPRSIWEKPGEWEFASRNYGLLTLIFQQIDDSPRHIFIHKLIESQLALGNGKPLESFSRERFRSGLPLVAEFCVRNGYLSSLMEMSSQLVYPNPNVAMMMVQMEEIIALNFDVFKKSELEAMPPFLLQMREIAEAQTWQTRHTRGKSDHESNAKFRPGFSAVGHELVASIDAFLTQCRRALYLYVEGILLQSRNPDVENDKVHVESFLQSLGFNSLLTAALNKAEELYTRPTDAFDRKSCIGHLRSFIEHLHIDAGAAIAASMGLSILPEWDPTLTFLKNKAFLTPQQDKLARGLYAVLSDEGVHPLISDQEFARLSRNMVIEYGLMFLTMFAKKGIKIS